MVENDKKIEKVIDEETKNIKNEINDKQQNEQIEENLELIDSSSNSSNYSSSNNSLSNLFEEKDEEEENKLKENKKINRKLRRNRSRNQRRKKLALIHKNGIFKVNYDQNNSNNLKSVVPRHTVAPYRNNLSSVPPQNVPRPPISSENLFRPNSSLPRSVPRQNTLPNSRPRHNTLYQNSSNTISHNRGISPSFNPHQNILHNYPLSQPFSNQNYPLPLATSSPLIVPYPNINLINLNNPVNDPFPLLPHPNTHLSFPPQPNNSINKSSNNSSGSTSSTNYHKNKNNKKQIYLPKKDNKVKRQLNANASEFQPNT